MGNVNPKYPKAQFGDLRKAAVTLAASQDYRVLSRIEPQRFYGDAEGQRLIRGLIVDSETTGLDPEVDLITEMAILPFTFTESGVIVEVLLDEAYVGLQDPCMPLSRKIKQKTGLTDEDLVGQMLDFKRISDLAKSAKLTIAHNAAFDRPLFERACPEFEKMFWACSQKMIAWSDEAVMGDKMEYIASSCGYFYEAHRAMSDCQALLHLLSRPLPVSDQMPLEVMMRELRREMHYVFIQDPPFGDDFKQQMYRLGYRWLNQPGYKGYGRLVARDSANDNLSSVMALLKKHSHKGPTITRVDPKDFFTQRPTFSRFFWPEALPTAEVAAPSAKQAGSAEAMSESQAAPQMA